MDLLLRVQALLSSDHELPVKVGVELDRREVG